MVTNRILVEVETQPPVEVTISDVGLPGPPGPPALDLYPIPWSRRGNQYVSVGTMPIYVEYPSIALGARAGLGVPCTGSDLVVLIRRNDVAFHQLTIPQGDRTSGYVLIPANTISVGDYFTLDVVQVGSTTPGTDLSVSLWLKVTA